MKRFQPISLASLFGIGLCVTSLNAQSLHWPGESSRFHPLPSAAQLLQPNLVVSGISLDSSVTGSVFGGNPSATTVYVRLKVAISNTGGSTAGAHHVTIRTWQQFPNPTFTTTFKVSNGIGAYSKTVMTFLVPLSRIKQGYEIPECHFDVFLDTSNVVAESNETDNKASCEFTYGEDQRGPFLAVFQQVIYRDSKPIPIPRPIKGDELRYY